MIVLQFTCVYILSTCRECFLPWYEINSSEQLVRHVSGALTEGMLVCKMNASEIKDYLALLLEQLKYKQIAIYIIIILL